MPVTKSPFVQLLENIKTNLQDQVNFPDTAVFKDRARVQPVFLPRGSATPYCCIVPGAQEGDSGNVEIISSEVTIYVVAALVSDDDNERLAIGTAAIEGTDTLCKVVRDALVRPMPYRDAPFASTPYVQQFQVLTAIHAATREFIAVPPPMDRQNEQPSFYLARPVVLRYGIYQA